MPSSLAAGIHLRAPGEDPAGIHLRAPGELGCHDTGAKHIQLGAPKTRLWTLLAGERGIEEC